MAENEAGIGPALENDQAIAPKSKYGTFWYFFTLFFQLNCFISVMLFITKTKYGVHGIMSKTLLCWCFTFYICFGFSGPPGQPKGPLKVKPLTKDSVTLDWKPPTSDGGSPVTSYSIEKREGTRHTWFHVANTRGTATDYTVTGLTENKDYAFRVYAENRYGRSQPLESDLMVAPKKVMGMYSNIWFNPKIKLTLFLLSSHFKQV